MEASAGAGRAEEGIRRRSDEGGRRARLTFGQRQQSDGHAQPPAAQADQVGALRLELQPLPALHQVQRSALRRENVSLGGAMHC